MAKEKVEKAESPKAPPAVKKDDEPKLNAATFCKIKNYSRGIQSRLEVWMREHKDDETEKTMAEWEWMYKKAMNRVTQ